MDANTYYEPSTSAARYFRENGEAPPETEECAAKYCDEQVEVENLSTHGLCPLCESERLEMMNEDTGYPNAGDAAMCLDCGVVSPVGDVLVVQRLDRPAAPQPEDAPLAAGAGDIPVIHGTHLKPIKMQGELFQQEVA